MPELPEVETVVRQIRPELLNKEIISTRVLYEKTIAPLSGYEFKSVIRGKTLKALNRRGKYIVARLDVGYFLIHLRMSGRLYVIKEGAETEADRWLRVSLTLDNQTELHFSDLRKFGTFTYLLNPDAYLAKLGPEPLDTSFTTAYLTSILEKRTVAIKSLLMNQSLIAGIGNIYADESLFRARIEPGRQAGSLSEYEIITLKESIQSVLKEAIEREGSSINWYRKPDGKTGTMQHALNVYGKEDTPCPRCGNKIVKIRLGGRGTHFCPSCQS